MALTKQPLAENAVNSVFSELPEINNVRQHKLDADHYSAEDIDGVTESLFGSGNMGYASLQSSQTASALEMTGLSTPLINESGTPVEYLNNTILGGTKNLFAADGDGFSLQDSRINDSGIASERNSGNGGNNVSNLNATDGLIAASSLGTAAASLLGSGARGVNDNGDAVGGGDDAATGANTNSSTSTTMTNSTTTTMTSREVIEGKDGRDGSDGYGGNGDTIIINNNHTVTNNTTTHNNTEHNTLITIDDSLLDITEVLNVLSVTISEVTNVLGDVINTVNQTHVLNVEDLTNVVIQISNSLTSVLNQTVTSLSTNLTDITNILNQTINITKGIDLDIDINALSLAELNIDLSLQQLLQGDVDIDLSADGIKELLENLGGLPGADALDKAVTLVEKVADGLQATVSQLTGKLESLGTIMDVTKVLDALGDLNTISDVVTGAVDSLLSYTPIGNLDAIDQTTALLEGLLDPGNGLLGGVGDVLGGGDNPNIIEQVLDATDTTLDNVTETAGETLENVENAVGDVLAGDIGGAVETLTETPIELVADVVNDAGALIDNVTAPVTEITELAGGLLDNVSGGATDDITDGVQGITDNLLGGDQTGIIEQIINATENAVDNVAETAGNTAENATDAVGDVLAGDIGGAVGTLTDTPTELVADAVDDVETVVSDLAEPLNDTTALAGGLLDNVSGGATDDITDGVQGITGNLLGGGEQTGIIEQIINAADNAVDNVAETAGDTAENVTDAVGDVLAGDIGGAVETLTDTPHQLLEDAAGDVAQAVQDVSVPVDQLLGGLTGGGLFGKGEDVGHTTTQAADDLMADVEQAIGNAVDMLGTQAADDCAEATDPQDDSSWTETTIGDAGGLFGDVAGAVTDNLPDPTGSVAEGIGALVVEPQLSLGNLGGGLFG